MLRVAERANGWVLAKLEESPFYPEGGGQVSDSGLVETPSGRARVVDVYRLGDDQALALEPLDGELGAGESATASVARDRRLATMRNHTATHLLHAALRRAARRPRAPGRLLRGPGQAALRLHARRAALPGRAARTWSPPCPAGWRPATVCTPSRPPATRPRRSARWPCSARSTATGCAWSRSRTCRASCAAAPTWAPPREIGLFHIATETSSASNVRRIEALTGPAAARAVPRAERAPRRARRRCCACRSTSWCSAVERLSERVKELGKKPTGGARP